MFMERYKEKFMDIFDNNEGIYILSNIYKTNQNLNIIKIITQIFSMMSVYRHYRVKILDIGGQQFIGILVIIFI